LDSSASAFVGQRARVPTSIEFKDYAPFGLSELHLAQPATIASIGKRSLSYSDRRGSHWAFSREV
jgi:hypothetical protein